MNGAQDSSMQQQHYPSASRQSQVVCGGCNTLLMFPQGAQNVRCARCRHITSVPPAGGNDMAQLVCQRQSCRVLLLYPRGATQVQCSMCSNINCALAANQIGHLICACCHMTLMFAHGAQSVKCAVCNHVTPVSASSVVQPQQQQSSAGASSNGTTTQPSGAPHRPIIKQSVVVENPPSLDQDGNEVQNLAIGVTTEPKAASARG
ncbi:g4880 [Coccomyxa viridis]|uniref:G4880 protein n=1 Tax=Coccomyxa viridis TaxID=1274662 RepID=A0ABP1FSV3_9CHLO